MQLDNGIGNQVCKYKIIFHTELIAIFFSKLGKTLIIDLYFSRLTSFK